jgi:hypothetical protein
MVPVAPEAILTQRIAQLRLRVRLLVTQRWIVVALLLATGVCAVAALVLRLLGLPLWIEWLPAVLGLAVVVGAVIGWTRRVTALETARLADQRLSLRERLSSGLAFLETPERDPLVAAQIEDAARHSARLEPRVAFPYRLPREARFLAATLLALLAVLFVPEIPFLQSPQARAEKAAMRREGEKLQRLAKEVSGRKTPTNGDVAKRVAENMRKLGIAMERGRVNKKQAMLASNKLTRELREAQRRLAADGLGPKAGSAAKPLDQAAMQMQQAADARNSGNATAGQRSLAEMARALQQRDFEAAARVLSALGDRLKSGEMSEAEARDAAATLGKMAEALKGTDLDKVSKELQEALKQLEQAQKLAKSLTPEQAEQLRKLAMMQAGISCGKAGGT